MRIYEYKCHECGAELEAANTIDERRTNAPLCCGVQTTIEIRTPPRGYVDNMEEYFCPVTRQGVTTRRQRNEIMAREGLVDANDFLLSDEKRREKQAEHDRKVAAAKAALPKELQAYKEQMIKQEAAKH